MKSRRSSNDENISESIHLFLLTFWKIICYFLEFYFIMQNLFTILPRLSQSHCLILVIDNESDDDTQKRIRRFEMRESKTLNNKKYRDIFNY